METSNLNVAHTSGEVSTLKDQGILAAAMHALEDFAPTFIPAGEPVVVACCPVCVGEPGSVGALRVEVVDTPKRLSWHCSLHHGGFSGVQYALSQHQAAKVSDLVLTEIPPSTKSDTSPAVDRVPDHQKEYRCENLRRVLHHLKDLGHLTAMPVRCRHCVGCVSWLKAKRVSRLIDASSDWDSVHIVTGLGATAYASLSRRIRRHGAEYVAIPVEDGRTLLTSDATVGGKRIEPGDLHSTFVLLVSYMAEGRISGTFSAKRKPQKTSNLSRERIGVTKRTAPELAAICLRHGAPAVVAERSARRGCNPLPTWDISSLSPDALLGLWAALGVRITRGVK